MSLCGKIISKIASLHYLAVFLVMFFIVVLTKNAHAQVLKPTMKADSTLSVKDSLMSDSAILSLDTLNKDTTKLADTSKRARMERELGIRISKDEMTDVVKAESQDSAVLDMRRNLFYLYGNAKVDYTDMEVKAGRIKFDQSTNIVSAEPLKDTLAVNPERPSFSQGKEKFTYDSLLYNFKTKKGLVREVRSQYGEGFVHSEQVKRNPDQSIYGYRNVYTTCALDTPHFGIVARKIKVIPGRVIASGAANIEIEGIPTPIYLPFGLFPISQKQRSGFIIPTYTIEDARGLGLVNGGYYFNLSNKSDLLFSSSFYTKGSWAVSGLTRYSDIYHYNGDLQFAYALNKTGQDYEQGASITKDFRLVWHHRTDSKAKPGETFNASVDAGTSTYYSNNSYDVNQIMQNQYSSNISYSKNWIGTPFSLTVSARHSQNTQTRVVDVTLPELNFYIAQFNPFQRRGSIGTHWYDKITASYTFNAQNHTTFIDSTFSFNDLSLNNMNYGAHHSIPISASYTVLRFINMSFSANYNEYWNTEQLFTQFDPARNGLDSVENRGFYATRDFNAGVNFSTRIYGMKLFKTGKIRGIRHVLTPALGFTYRPDFGASPFNYYYLSRVDSFNYRYQSPYQTSVIGYPPSGKQGLITFGLGNTLQMKTRSAKDTITGFRNISLIDGFDIGTSYNMAVDSFQWAPLTLSFRTNVLDKLNITARADFDPYAIDYTTGRRTPELLLDKGDGLLHFSDAQISLGTNFHSKSKSSSSNTNSDEYTRLMRNNGRADYVDFNIPWSFNVSYSLTVNSSPSLYSHKDTFTVAQYAQFQGDFNVTPTWKVGFSSGYDFTAHQLSPTQLNLYRDLHCWEMRLSAIPFGPRKLYTFTLNVKAAILQDMKLTRRRDFRDAAY